MFRKQFHFAVLRVFLSKALQDLKETPDDRESTFFNTANFQRFDVQSPEVFSPQLKDQTDLCSSNQCPVNSSCQPKSITGDIS